MEDKNSKVSNEVLVEFDSISLSFDTNEVLKNISFRLKRGESMSILGASGSGKSTILRLIMGLIKPDAGRILINGSEITSMEEHELVGVRKSIGMVFQGSALFDSLTVGENVGYRLREEGFSEEEISQRVLEKLRFVGLEDTINLMPSELSGGMKKRVAIARALASDPCLMLYDEPTTGLDPITARMVSRHIMELSKRSGISSIVVTHELFYAFSLTKRIIMIREGGIIFDGTRDELKRNSDPYIQEYLSQEGL